MSKQAIAMERPPGVESGMAAGAKEPRPIAVRRLRMRHGQGIEFPGRAGESTCTSEPEKFGTLSTHWKIDYMPWIRHHRIEYHPASSGAIEIWMVPESCVAWEPLG